MTARSISALLAAAIALAPLAGGCRARPTPPSRLVVLALDSLDPEVVDLLAGEGALPNLDRLRREGAYGPLRSREPLLSPVVWTTIATGRTDHGIDGFVTEDEPPVPVNRRMRKRKAVWNIASEAGRTVGVVGWWATWPAEDVRGFVVSDRLTYHYLNRGAFEDRPVADLTFPADLAAAIGPLVRRPASVTLEEARAFVEVDERAFALPFDFRDPLEHFKWALASAETYRRVGLDLWGKHRPDLLFVYFEAPDTVSHLFGHLFRAPEPPGGAGEAQRRYGRAVEAMYRYADRLVGEYLAAGDERTTFVVVSDHGFALGPPAPGEAVSATGRRVGAGSHRLDGVLFMAGYGVRAGVRLEGASILDVAPTLLALTGLGAARDMPGKILTEALAKAPPTRVESYEPPVGSVAPAGPVVRDEAVDPEVLEHLKALGYVAPKPAVRAPGATPAPDLEALRREAAQHPDDPKSLARLAEGGLRAGRLDLARAEAERALAVEPLFAPAHHVLGGVHEAEGRPEEALRSYRNALRCNPRFEPSRQAHERLTGSPDPLAPRTPAEARALELTAQASRAAAVLDYRAALLHLEEAERLAPRLPVIFQYRSNIHFLMGDEAAAVAALRAGLRAVPGDVLFRENLRRLLEEGKGDETPGRPQP